jgi:hypothetical protein
MPQRRIFLLSRYMSLEQSRVVSCQIDGAFVLVTLAMRRLPPSSVLGRDELWFLKIGTGLANSFLKPSMHGPDPPAPPHTLSKFLLTPRILCLITPRNPDGAPTHRAQGRLTYSGTTHEDYKLMYLPLTCSIRLN